MGKVKELLLVQTEKCQCGIVERFDDLCPMCQSEYCEWLAQNEEQPEELQEVA